MSDEAERMRAVTVPAPGGPEALTPTTVPIPRIGEDDVLIRVAAAGVNGADLAQRRGVYPAPSGAPDWPGLEVSGTIVDVGAKVESVDVGDDVCALLPGGGYAEYVAVHSCLVLPVPHGVSLRDAAGLPEAAATAWANLVMCAGLRAGQTALIHGGSSGVGHLAVQLALAIGARVVATASTPEKVAFCAGLGAEAVNYREQDFAAEVVRFTDGHGADVVLDMVGGDYIARDLDALALDGTIMAIADRSGAPIGVPVGRLMAVRGRLWATTLRSRPLAARAAVMAELHEHVWPLIEHGFVHPTIDSVVPLESAADAHRRMESSAHIGKILLEIG